MVVGPPCTRKTCFPAAKVESRSFNLHELRAFITVTKSREKASHVAVKGVLAAKRVATVEQGLVQARRSFDDKIKYYDDFFRQRMAGFVTLWGIGNVMGAGPSRCVGTALVMLCGIEPPRCLHRVHHAA